MPPTPPISDDHLLRYLLGAAPPDEAERLDEESLVDDDLAERLRVLEDDLVDSYAAGTLTGDRLQRFESFYLASPRRRNKAALALGLRGALERSQQQPRPLPDKGGERPPTIRGATITRRPGWALAVAAALVIALAALLAQNVMLRRELRDSARLAAAADQRATAASRQLEIEQEATATARQALVDARTATLAAVALVLLPQTRGVASVPIIAVPTGSSAVPLDLALEAPGGGSYDAALRDPATNHTIWRSPALALQRVRQTPIVPISLPAAVLKAQHYALDLFELRSGQAPEFVSSYAFEVVRQ